MAMREAATAGKRTVGGTVLKPVISRTTVTRLPRLAALSVDYPDEPAPLSGGLAGAVVGTVWGGLRVESSRAGHPGLRNESGVR